MTGTQDDDAVMEELYVDYAVAGALTDDTVWGKSPGRQVQPILDYLDARGWAFVRKDDKNKEGGT